jgi:hypothetical protein
MLVELFAPFEGGSRVSRGGGCRRLYGNLRYPAVLLQCANLDEHS